MLRIGTANWNIPKSSRDAFPGEGSHLERYATRFSCVEINSSFHRAHRPSTYERWAQSVPADFAFSLKVPKEITHKRKLLQSEELLREFVDASAHLGPKRSVLLVQLPPSFALDANAAGAFFSFFRDVYGGALACEARHASWFSPAAEALLQRYRITQAGADPPPVEAAAVSVPHGGFAYYRWHGSPRTYYSAYSQERIAGFAERARASGAPETWCIFDNTALDAATQNALDMQAMSGDGYSKRSASIGRSSEALRAG